MERIDAWIDFRAVGVVSAAVACDLHSAGSRRGGGRGRLDELELAFKSAQVWFEKDAQGDGTERGGPDEGRCAE